MFRNYQPWVIATYGDSAKTKTITLRKHARILRTLRGEETNSVENSKFRFWVKAKGFRMGRPPGYVPKPADSIVGTQALPGQSPHDEPPLYVPVATAKSWAGGVATVLAAAAVGEAAADVLLAAPSRAVLRAGGWAARHFRTHRTRSCTWIGGCAAAAASAARGRICYRSARGVSVGVGCGGVAITGRALSGRRASPPAAAAAAAVPTGWLSGPLAFLWWGVGGARRWRCAASAGKPAARLAARKLRLAAAAAAAAADASLEHVEVRIHGRGRQLKASECRGVSLSRVETPEFFPRVRSPAREVRGGVDGVGWGRQTGRGVERCRRPVAGRPSVARARRGRKGRRRSIAAAAAAMGAQRGLASPLHGAVARGTSKRPPAAARPGRPRALPHCSLPPA
ncbi:uncharacterized protein LOC126092676 [Schistocerca cancellata]|uniref:uncharacterized protein LOC126092676 n=1 Tax=Schistocerca cancellata TaxID=274614 RepID=UPI0021183922|nr:uncharacterized protein LOC126092676 [Schistocerca cancellata]